MRVARVPAPALEGPITGGAFVPNGLWGAAYDGGYLYADYVCGKILLLQPDGSGGWNNSRNSPIGARLPNTF